MSAKIDRVCREHGFRYFQIDQGVKDIVSVALGRLLGDAPGDLTTIHILLEKPAAPAGISYAAFVKELREAAPDMVMKVTLMGFSQSEGFAE